ncbi:MAG: ribosome rescue protein RqcH, partial [Promethearchaeota archaeon]
MKSNLNNIDIFTIICEIKELVINKNIKNFYQLDDTTFILTFRCVDGVKQLLIKLPNGMYLSEFIYEKPRFPPNFCISIRKYIKDRKILNFYQYKHLDRMVILEIQGIDKSTWRLILEFFGKGNIILLKPTGYVQIAARYFKLKSEVVLPNRIYNFPVQNFKDIFEVEIDTLRESLTHDSDAVSKILSTNFNINSFYAMELCLKSNIDVKSPGSSLSESQINKLFEAIKELEKKLKKREFSPCIIAKTSDFKELKSVEPFKQLQFSGYPVKEFDSFNQAVDEYFSYGLILKAKEEKKEKKKLSKNERILKAQYQQLENLKSKSQEYVELGNLLYQYFPQLSKLLDTIYKARKKGISWDEIINKISVGKKQGIEEALFFESAEIGSPIIKVNVERRIIPLDIRYSLTENIEKFFYSKSKKAKKKIPGALKTIQRVSKLIEKEKISAAENMKKMVLPAKRRKKEWFEKFRWFYSSDGYLVLAGRDASTNELLFSRYMQPNDLFFHSDVPGSPIVLVKNHPGESIENIPIQTRKEAAVFGVSYSRAWKLELKTADIYSVSPDQVSKTPPSGEYLPKGSFMIRGERNYYKNVRLELVVGIQLVEQPITLDKLK